MVDLEATALDYASRPVPFLASNAMARGTLVHGIAAGDVLGKVYVTFGNVRDVQPYHGWIFEVSLDDWLAGGAGKAVRASLTVTPDQECGLIGASGSRDHVCGGGLWAPFGPLIVPKGDTYELVLAPDNGRLDLLHHEYARTLMRVGPGLAFEDGCDPSLCQTFDENAPDRACVESCGNLFVPRLLPGDAPFAPESGVCDGITNMFECWYKLDYPGGGAAGTHRALRRARGARVSEQGRSRLSRRRRSLGTLYDRKEIVAALRDQDRSLCE